MSWLASGVLHGISAPFEICAPPFFDAIFWSAFSPSRGKFFARLVSGSQKIFSRPAKKNPDIRFCDCSGLHKLQCVSTRHDGFGPRHNPRRTARSERLKPSESANVTPALKCGEGTKPGANVKKLCEVGPAQIRKKT